MRHTFSGLIITMLVAIFTTTASAQNKQQLLADFKQYYPTINTGINSGLEALNVRVDPAILEVMNSVIPRVINEDYRGATLVVSNIIYQKTGSKVLSPQFTNTMDLQFHQVYDAIVSKNYTLVGLTMLNTIVTANRYLKSLSVEQQEVAEEIVYNPVSSSASGEYKINKTHFEEPKKSRVIVKSEQEYLQEANQFHKQMNYVASLEVINEGLSKHLNSYTLYYARAYIYVYYGRYSEAINDLSVSLTLNDKSADIWHYRGELYYKTGEYYNCVSDMTKAIKLKGSGNSFYYRGLANLKLEMSVDGCEDLNRANKLQVEGASAAIKKYCNW